MIYNSFKRRLLEGGVDFVNDTIKVALLVETYSFDSDNHEFFSDVQLSEITGATGYTAGGNILSTKSVTQDDTDDEGVFTSSNVNWSSSTITAARFAIIYKDTGIASTSPLIAVIDFGTNQSSLNQTFEIQWNGEGILNIN